VTDKSTSVQAETSITIGVNSPPSCNGAALSLSTDDCIGNVGTACPVTAMQTKLQVALHDASNSVASCSDADGPIKYQLLSFSSSCSASAKGRVIGTSPAPSFASITLANGVKSIGIEAIDALGAISRTCSQDISVNAVSEAVLSGLFQSSSASLAGDAEGQKRLVSNVAGSLSSLYAASNSNTAALDSVKAQALTFLSASTSSALADAADASLAVSSLHSLVVLPGTLSSAQTSSVVSMFDKFSASSLNLLLTGAATVQFAIEVSPMLVEGSLNALGKSISPSRSRSILAYQNGMETAYSAIVSAAKVQSFAMAAGQDAAVKEQAPSLVQGVRRLRSATPLASIVPSSALMLVAVAVAPDADASTAVDVGLVVVIQATSPFTDTASTVLISPSVALTSFNADTGTTIPGIRNVIEAKFPVSQSSHDSRTVINAAGQRRAEGCVVYDGTSWRRSCSIGAYSTSTNSITCTCNATATTLAIAAAEFVVDCSGTFGGSLVLDACKACGGSITDASKCSPEAGAAVNIALIAGGVVGGCIVIALAFFMYFRKQKQSADIQVSQKPPPPTFNAPAPDAPTVSRPFARKHQPTIRLPEPEILDEVGREDSPERILPGSPAKFRSPAEASGTSSALNQTGTFERGPSQSERYRQLLARQRAILDQHSGVFPPQSQHGANPSDSSPSRPGRPAFLQPKSPHDSNHSGASPSRLAHPTYDSSLGIQAASGGTAALQERIQAASGDTAAMKERYNRVLMMRQRLSLGLVPLEPAMSTVIPLDSPVLTLPASRANSSPLDSPANRNSFEGSVQSRLERLRRSNESGGGD